MEEKSPVTNTLWWGTWYPWAQGDTGLNIFIVTGLLFLLASSLGFHGDTADILHLQRRGLVGVYPLKSPLFTFTTLTLQSGWLKCHQKLDSFSYLPSPSHHHISREDTSTAPSPATPVQAAPNHTLPHRLRRVPPVICHLSKKGLVTDCCL